jgi:hypothetical protein
MYHGTKLYTAGGSTRQDLMQNRHGRIVFKSRHLAGKMSWKTMIKNSRLFRMQWDDMRKRNMRKRIKPTSPPPPPPPPPPPCSLDYVDYVRMRVLG